MPMDAFELIAKVVKFLLFLVAAIVWFVALPLGFILAVPFLLYVKPGVGRTISLGSLSPPVPPHVSRFLRL